MHVVAENDGAANVGGASCTAADGCAGSVRTAFKFDLSPGHQGLSPPDFPFPTSLHEIRFRHGDAD